MDHGRNPEGTEQNSDSNREKKPASGESATERLMLLRLHHRLLTRDASSSARQIKEQKGRDQSPNPGTSDKRAAHYSAIPESSVQQAGSSTSPAQKIPQSADKSLVSLATDQQLHRKRMLDLEQNWKGLITEYGKFIKRQERIIEAMEFNLNDNDPSMLPDAKRTEERLKQDREFHSIIFDGKGKMRYIPDENIEYHQETIDSASDRLREIAETQNHHEAVIKRLIAQKMLEIMQNNAIPEIMQNNAIPEIAHEEAGESERQHSDANPLRNRVSF